MGRHGLVAGCARNHCRLVTTALLLLCLLAVPCEGALADGGVLHRAPAPADADATGVLGLEDGLPREVCAIAKMPLKAGTNALIRLVSRGRYRGTLAGTIFTSVGFNPWCKGSYSRLRNRLRSLTERRPALTRELGTWVFNLHATAVPSSIYRNSSYFRVRWSEFPRLTVLDTYYLWYSINGGRFFQVRGGQNIHLLRGNRVQFAVRIVNLRGETSPYVYSPRYYT